MIYFGQNEVKNARQIDLLTYLRQYEPHELVHVAGNIYCIMVILPTMAASLLWNLHSGAASTLF